MQSARPHVLRILDRTHTPGRPEAVVAEARAAGFTHVNLDLIYGTPGESDEDWRASLESALSAQPRPRLRVRPDRRGGHTARAPHPPRRDPHDGRRRARGPLPHRGGRAVRRGDELVRGLQLGLGSRSFRTLPSQRAVLDRRRLVGRRTGRTQPRRRRPLVERQAPGLLRPGTRTGPLPGRRPRTDSAPRTGASRGSCWSCGSRRAARSNCWPPRGRRQLGGRCPRGCWSPDRTSGGARCSPCAGGCWPTLSYATWSTDSGSRSGSGRHSLPVTQPPVAQPSGDPASRPL